MLRKVEWLIFILILALILPSVLFAQRRGSIVGTVTDESTGDALPGANLSLVGTALGAASDLQGEYKILRIPPGTYTVRASFMGYQQNELQVQVQPGRSVELNFKLIYDIVEGETVTITAQAAGQAAAINQQIRSNTITNVVSAERIMEFPDANAAESVGRLPGISIKRSGGEGNKVVIRGLSPTYNLITIGGERIPATDLNDRSVDLNMISPEILSGIEVVKALTPDKDADTFGGTVDFKLADARSGGFHSSIRLRTGYNDQRQEYGQYKVSISLSNRFWNNRLGVLVTGNTERAQRGNDRMSAGYETVREKREGEQFAPITVSSVSLRHINEVRKRTAYNVLLDYRFKRGKIKLSNFLSRLDRNELINRSSYSKNSNKHNRYFQDRQRQTDVQSNSLTGEHNLYIGDLDWRVSRTASLTRHPWDSNIRFQERTAFDLDLAPTILGPRELVSFARENWQNSEMYEGYFSEEKSYERDFTTQLNFKLPFTLTNRMAGYFKLGGKYREKYKVRDAEGGIVRLDRSNDIVPRNHSRWGEPGFEYQYIMPQKWPSIANYIDPNFDQGDFLEGDYDYGPGLDGDEIDRLYRRVLVDSVLRYNNWADLEDYQTYERVSAGYIMAEINIGRLFMFLPGVRYEYVNNDMVGRVGVVPWTDSEESGITFIRDTTAVNNYDNWFPMFHFRVRPTDWFDVRLAYTKSSVHPRLSWMLPFKRVHGERQLVEFGRPDLQPQLATNYDVFLSFYGNNVGLLTVAGFYKEISDLIFNRKGHKILNAEKEGFPRELQGLTLNRPENSGFLTTVRGYEFEWQTNFRWLPRPLDGIVLNVNYTHLSSKTRYPRSVVEKERIPVFPFIKTSVNDTSRSGAMLDQSDDIANVSLGYDWGPFSARISMLYQGRTLSGIGERPEADEYTADLLRWDSTFKYRVGRNLDIFFNFNNMTNEPDESYRFDSTYPSSREVYGWTSDIGIGYSF